jgi:uncharacterized membrane protein YphA (DoxX/SURF4 family)
MATSTARPKNYPGLLPALLLILLRTAIGWHFLYEGLTKVQSIPDVRDSFAGRALAAILPPPPGKEKENPFSAEGYLRNSTGPLAPYFRGMVPDVNSLGKLETDASGRPARLKATWADRMARAVAHYGFDADQHSRAEEALREADFAADQWFMLADNRDRVNKYMDDLRKVIAVERDPQSLAFQREAAWKKRREIESARKELVAEVDGWTKALDARWLSIATDAQKARGPLPTPISSMDLINLSVIWGTVIVGLLLILGFFSRLSALGAASFLVMFYLSMPPWRGLPDNPLAEGHYLIVNKNLIEFLACLVLASLPTGLWLGLDALFFGRRSRRREMARLLARQPADIPAPEVVHAGAVSARRR